jgi:hypothetical protein
MNDEVDQDGVWGKTNDQPDEILLVDQLASEKLQLIA